MSDAVRVRVRVRVQTCVRSVCNKIIICDIIARVPCIIAMISTQTVATAVLFAAIAVTCVDAAPNVVPLGRLKHSAEKMVRPYCSCIFSCPPFHPLRSSDGTS